MGYLKIPNLYKDQTILLFKECYALEKLHGCIPSGVNIRMADGSKKEINKISVGDEVACVKGGVLSSTVVTETFRNGTKSEWTQVGASCVAAGTGPASIKLTTTPEHRFLLYETNEYIEAKNLKIGDKISVLRRDVRLPPLQFSIILGKLLGDGFLQTNRSSASLQFGHRAEDKEYVEWTCRGLGELALNTRRHRQSGYGSQMIGASTHASGEVLARFGEFYKTGKKTVPGWVETALDPVSIAFWYMDDGSLAHDDGQEDRVLFATNGFSKEDCEILVKGLDRFGITAKLYEASGWRLRVDRESSEKLFLLVAPYIPPCMQRKLPLRYRGSLGWLPEVGVQFAPTITSQTVTSIEHMTHSKPAFDLETEAHNYITAAGFVVHNSSAHAVVMPNEVRFFSGGEKYSNFVALFDQEDLKQRFKTLNLERVTVYGEAYGGKQQGMAHTYGPKLKFAAFDVKVSKHTEEGLREYWLNVEDAAAIVGKLGLEFVAYNRVSTDPESLNHERDLPSRQAVRNGITEPKIAEGVVLRPLQEFMMGGSRVIAKHKRPEFSERTSKRDSNLTPEQREVLTKARDIAKEWVTEMRLQHVLSKFHANNGRPANESDTKVIIQAMVEDVHLEAKGEIVESKEAVKAMGSATAKLFFKFLGGSYESQSE